jgi:NADPH:quinone reductase-like Zn-dependent oxidoreductase
MSGAATIMEVVPASGRVTMRAAVYSTNGSPDVIRIKDVGKPAPNDNEVLIEVRAASINPLDVGLLKGMPYIFRLIFGLRKPNDTGLGVDVAGNVEAVGRNVTQFKPGDAVFGACIRDPQDSAMKVWNPRGAFAEYVCAPEQTLVRKPANVTFEEAASVPVAAFTALQGLRDKGMIQPGQRVLINGASGGVGTFAVQIAKSFGAEVTGVCSTRNVEMVGSIGADHVIDYTKENFTQGEKRYDLIFDCVGNYSLSSCRLVLGPRGRLVMVGELSGRGMIGLVARLLTALVLSRLVSQKLVPFIAKPNKGDLTVMHDLLKAGKVKPVIERCYSVSELPDALRYLSEKHARGKLVISFGSKGPRT